jgi:acyl dehydratase
MTEFTIDTAPSLVGQKLVTTDWLTITQDQVDGFAAATLDPDWMHIDVERSRKESPYGGTIVQGFLNMTLVIYFSHNYAAQPSDVSYGLNYGVDRVRFLTPVLVGSRIRDHIILKEFEQRDENRFFQKTGHTIEAEGEEKPAAVVDFLVLWFRELRH